MNKKVVVIIVIIAIIAAILVALLLVALLLVASLFTVDETEQARVMEYNAAAAKIFTEDKKRLVIDIYARWKIIDPLKFYQTVGNEFGAQSRLDDIVFSEMREELARHTLTEIVSVNRQQIMDEITEQCNRKAGDYGIQVIDVQIKRADLPQER